MRDKLNNVPQELRKLKQWVVYKKNKHPLNPITLAPAKTNDPSTWGTFDEACKAVEQGKALGIGFVFTADDPYVGIDLDHVIDDNGQIEPWAQEIIDQIGSYTEVSMSGHGIHIIAIGKKPGGNCKKKGIEVYDRVRFFALTGVLWQDRGEIRDAQEELESIYEAFGLGRSSSDGDSGGTGTAFNKVQEGNRRNHLVSKGGSMNRARFGYNAILAALREENEAVCDPPLEDKEVASIAKSLKYEHDPIETIPLTDAGNAEIMVMLYGDDLRYDHKQKRWLVWGGHYWKPDRDALVARLALEAARMRYTWASEIEDHDLKKKVSARAIQSENRVRIDYCLSLASRIKPFANEGDNWDRDPMLLGAENGVIDLGKGELRPGRREDRITMSVGFDYDSDAECPRWESFLLEVFTASAFVDYMWRLLGYSITGDTSEHVVPMGWGDGANGKTKLYRAIFDTLGDYAHITPFSTFSLPQYGNTNDMAALDLKRFVCSSETNTGTRLNVERIKALSGEDPVSARFLYREFETFVPYMKLWLFFNNKPEVDDETIAIWRRVRLIPFTKRFVGEEADKKLGEKLKREAPGILTWLVRGCLEWQKRGLSGTPKPVEEATHEYRKESDPILRFVNECCNKREGLKVKASTLYEAFKKWSGNESKWVTQTMFGKRLSANFEKKNRSSGVFYIGIDLKGPTLEFIGDNKIRVNLDEVD